ncbi:EAL domain-containing protein [Saliterribacillus persicus]|uniref:EAL domain-containing protein (Putative c-di-GMP-specific phosphodiesterase class I) n=1 Tax=Saliterribacillus persicus TaxID=930114 RepID=A0A368X7K6_9BACI|nr:EAL domain-containing protein [Saliterribacillus persicus]RCW63176.1 EAL domain-containing protein (putative c-di-GMP-specific phosphodiesterase class I) [Saliterribacillus persicus]
MESHLLSRINEFGYWKYLSDRFKKEIINYKKFQALDKIVKKKDISTFFQPLINMQNGETLGYEVLNRPPISKEFSSTEAFYEFIGKTNQVFSFEYFCRNISLERYIEKTNNLEPLIFLNIHPKVLIDSNYKSGETAQLLKKFNIQPNQIVFELTERESVTDFDHFVYILNHYRSQGFRVAVDDAGSGFNSLKTLAYLKPEFIKIDKSLIQDIDQDNVKQQLVTMLLEFSQSSNTDVIAEGIESVGEFQYLREKGVNFGQGYLFGRPEKELQAGKLPNV